MIGALASSNPSRSEAGDVTGTAVPVTAEAAKRQDVPELIETIGSVESIDAIAIQSQANGPIVKIEFQPGQDVKQGQELFLIDPRPYEAALEQAQAQLEHDQALLAEAQTDLARYQKLARENSIAKQQPQDQLYVVQQDEGTVKIDEANVKTAQINLDYTHIRSPIDGRAGVLLVDLGNLVGPQNGGGQSTANSKAATTSSAAPLGQTISAGGLVTVTQMRPIYVSFSIPQTLLETVAKSQAKSPLAVEAYAQSGKLLATGKLAVIDNQVNLGTGSVTMQGTFANDDETLWPGEFVSVSLVVAVRRDAVTVPAHAVMTGPDGPYVYVVSSDQTVRRVGVHITLRRGGIAVIDDGVAAGALVVTDGQYRLADGVKVDVRQPGPQAK